jgi:RNA polymerase sigma factor (sigma-70 family)
MSQRLLRWLVDRLRAAAGPAPENGVTDGELLDRYDRGRDQAAFELLVRRHGALVLGVCRRVLRDAHAAEDAFQATFLILARKMRSVRRRATIAGWLYRVALRVAVRARRGVRREAPLVKEPAVEEPDRLAGQELRAVLDDELGRLPERFRLPVLLCYVEGHTTEQAARMLGCPRGTVLSRLATARKRLCARLARRGVELPAAGVAVVLAEQALTAAVPAVLIAVAVRGAAGQAGSAGAVHLAQGVLHAMFLNKLACALGAVVVVGALAVTAGRFASETPAREEGQPPARAASVTAQQPAEPPRAEERLAQLDRARDELRMREGLLDKVEQQASLKITEARLKLLELQEQLRVWERKQEFELVAQRRKQEREERDGEPLTLELREKTEELARRIRDLKAASKEPNLETLRRLEEELRKYREKLLTEMRVADAARYDERERAEQRYSKELLDLRTQILIAEEALKQLERRVARETGRALADVEAAAARVRQLEGLSPAPPAPDRPNAELSRKLDDLAREVADIKKELKRRREDK